MTTKKWGAVIGFALPLVGMGCGDSDRDRAAEAADDGWEVVEAFGVQSQGLDGALTPSLNPRAAGRRVEASMFQSYLYDWNGIRVSAEVSLGEAAGTMQRSLRSAEWQEPWIARLSPSALPRGSFDELQEALGRDAEARRRLLARESDLEPLCPVGSLSESPLRECLRALVCVFGYSRFALLVDPQAPSRTRVSSGAPSTPFEPWRRFGHPTAAQFCEAEAGVRAG